VDLSNKSIEELDALQAAIESEKESAKTREMEVFLNLVEQVKAKAEVLGLKVKDYFVAKKETVKKVYRNPETGEEFGGKGPRPDWIKAKLEGIDPSDKAAIKAKMNEFLVQ
jgi:DNA-binding protein H-NS